MKEAINTITELFCNSPHDGQVTLFINSSYASTINLFTTLLLHGWSDSNTQPAVLETAALPIELHPYLKHFFLDNLAYPILLNDLSHLASTNCSSSFSNSKF